MLRIDTLCVTQTYRVVECDERKKDKCPLQHLSICLRRDCMCMTHTLRCTSAPFHTGIQPAGLYPDVVKTRPARHSGYRRGGGLYTHIHSHSFAITQRDAHTNVHVHTLLVLIPSTEALGLDERVKISDVINSNVDIKT